MAAAALRARGLGMRFEGLVALADIDLDVPPGQIRGLIGPNGAGKTTCFNCLSGFYQPTDGQVLLDGTRVDGLRPHQLSALGVARTFQNIRLFSNMSAIENVLAGGQTHLQGRKPDAKVSRPSGNRLVDIARQLPGVPVAAGRAITEMAFAVARPPAAVANEREALRQARHLLEFAGLRGRENLIARNLPYGDQRRLELARALAARPRLLLLDEPTAGMNPQESASMVGLIRRIRDELETTIILIEHQMRVVMGVCEQITVLDYGRKIAEGSPAEVQRDARVVEAYLGSRAHGGEPRGTA